MPERTSLYERLGGAEGISKLVDSFYAKVLADPDLAPIFANSSVDHIKSMQREYISVAVGAPNKAYAGRPLTDVHAGRGITQRHFFLFGRRFLETLEEAGASPDDAYDAANRLARNANEVTGEAPYMG